MPGAASLEHQLVAYGQPAPFGTPVDRISVPGSGWSAVRAVVEPDPDAGVLVISTTPAAGFEGLAYGLSVSGARLTPGSEVVMEFSNDGASSASSASIRAASGTDPAETLAETGSPWAGDTRAAGGPGSRGAPPGR
jgi:hypothetical protein